MVTITKDNYEELFETLSSIRKVFQKNLYTNKNLGEIIIIDGSNYTKKIEVDKLLGTKISSQIRIKIIQEKDSGIYDAMNKGINHSSFELIQFINSGDKLLGFVPEGDLAHIIKTDNIAGIATDVLIKFTKKTHLRKARKLKSQWRIAMPAIHQGIIYKRNILSKVPFSEEYKVCGDFDNICHLISLNFKFHIVNKTTATLTSGGISTTKPLLLFYESVRIYRKYFDPNWFLLTLYGLKLMRSIILYQLYNKFGQL